MNLFIILLSLVINKSNHYDTTYLCNLKSKEIKSKIIELPAGKTTIEVLSGENNYISCTYMNEAGAIGLTQNNTNVCSGNLVSTDGQKLTIWVENNQKSDIEYRIHVFN